MRVIAGPEKKARLLSEKEQRITAYHEMGHALVGHFLENTEPGPQDHDRLARPGARPDDLAADRGSLPARRKQALLEEIAMTLGGRAAEELVFNEITTGAANDIEKVTHTAKQMVMRFGMSEKLGPRVLGRDARHAVPRPRDGRTSPTTRTRSRARSTTRSAASSRRATSSRSRVLREHMDELHRISQILIERETIDKDQFERAARRRVRRTRSSRAPERRAAGAARRSPSGARSRSRGRSRSRARRMQPPPEPEGVVARPARCANQFGGRRAHARADRGALPAPVGDGRRSTSRPTRSRTAACTSRRARRSRRRGGCSTAGAAIVDVGGESTRPGSDGVDADEELRRVVPVLETLAGAPVSIDTSKAEVARRALELGAELVNDVTALRGDPELAGVVADARLLPLPDAHAGRAADDAGRPGLRRRRLRGEARSSRSGSRSRSRRGSARSSSASIPASASARRSTHNFELVRRLDELRRARPAGARRLLAQELARRAPRRRRATGSRGGVGRRRGRRVRARRDDPARARRARARRGAARPRGRWRAREDRAARARAARLPRRLPEEERDGPAVPLRRRARGRRARRRRRLEHAVDYTRGRGDGPRGERDAASGCSKRSLSTLADTLLERFAPERVRVRVRKPEVRAGRPPGRVQRRHRRAAMTLAYVGLGANLGDRESLIRRAAELIGARAAVGRCARPSRGGYERPAAVPERRRRARDRARAARAARPPARRRARARPRARSGRAGGRARSTSTCCSTATRRSTSRASSCPIRGCTSGGSCSSRSPSSFRG